MPAKSMKLPDQKSETDRSIKAILGRDFPRETQGADRHHALRSGADADSESQASKVSQVRHARNSQMAVRHQIKCINKSDRNDPHERVTHVGSTIPEGGRWKLTQTDAIAGIESGKWSFWVQAGGEAVDVIVTVSADGHKYLKARTDGEQPTNLLILPECP